MLSSGQLTVFFFRPFLVSWPLSDAFSMALPSPLTSAEPAGRTRGGSAPILTPPTPVLFPFLVTPTYKSPSVLALPQPVPACQVDPSPSAPKRQWAPGKKVWWSLFQELASPQRDWAGGEERRERLLLGRGSLRQGGEPNIREGMLISRETPPHLGRRGGQHLLLLLNLNARDGSRVEGVEEAKSFHSCKKQERCHPKPPTDPKKATKGPQKGT